MGRVGGHMANDRYRNMTRVFKRVKFGERRHITPPQLASYDRIVLQNFRFQRPKIKPGTTDLLDNSDVPCVTN